jgi:PIN domain nuclease of toxin-antitoxin system
MGSTIVIVLDTHAWVWWLTKPNKLGKKAARAIDKADRIGVPSIAVWEVAMKAEGGKLRFDRPYDIWIDEALNDDPRVELLHLLPSIAVEAVRLSWEHGDPADRFIVATARCHDAMLVTADERIHGSRLIRCAWD